MPHLQWDIVFPALGQWRGFRLVTCFHTVKNLLDEMSLKGRKQNHDFLASAHISSFCFSGMVIPFIKS